MHIVSLLVSGLFHISCLTVNTQVTWLRDVMSTEDLCRLFLSTSDSSLFELCGSKSRRKSCEVEIRD